MSFLLHFCVCILWAWCLHVLGAFSCHLYSGAIHFFMCPIVSASSFEVGYLLLMLCQCWICHIMLPSFLDATNLSMHNLEMLICHVLLSMSCPIIPCFLTPYICPIAYVFIATDMLIQCSRFLLTSWCYVVNLILINSCLFWRFSNYMFCSMLWILCLHTMIANFGCHMPLFHACKFAIIMLLFYTCWNCSTIQSYHVCSH